MFTLILMYYLSGSYTLQRYAVYNLSEASCTAILRYKIEAVKSSGGQVKEARCKNAIVNL